MKLKEYNALTSNKQPRGAATVRCNRKTGQIMFSAKAAHDIGLSDGKHVSIFQDEDRPKDWYVSLSDEKSGGFKLRQNSSSQGVVFNSTHIARSILDSVGNTDNSATMMMGKETDLNDKSYWAIITSVLNNK